MVLPLFLGACTTSKVRLSANDASYAIEIRKAVQEKMYLPDSYKRKACTIRISLGRDGSVGKAMVENGDPKLCQAALIAVKHANIPPAPDEKTWQSLKNTILYFKY